MGQQQSLKNSLSNFTGQSFYQLDARLLQKLQHYASSFPSDIQTIIVQTQQFYKRQPSHLFTDFFISQINSRFCNLTINQEALTNATNSKTILQIFHINPKFLEHKEWYQLATKDRFLKFLQRLEEKYWIEEELHQILQRQQQQQELNSINNSIMKGTFQLEKQTNTFQKPTHSSVMSIRKPFKPKSSLASYKSQISQPLFKKLFFYYYLNLMRTFFSSKNGTQRSAAINYHVQIGTNILKIVAAQYISEQKLFQLLYEVVKLQKTHKSLQKLRSISAEYQSYCLKHQHNLSIDKQKLQKVKLFAKCYLDQLYFMAIKEAEDPQIVQDGGLGDGGLMLKNFPINRVKERNRNM